VRQNLTSTVAAEEVVVKRKSIKADQPTEIHELREKSNAFVPKARKDGKVYFDKPSPDLVGLEKLALEHHAVSKA
jgi:hypothetical protein